MTPLLAQRARSADRAFERIYRRHAGDVYRYALAVLRNPADAEDVTQTTFLNAYRAIQRGDRPEKAQNWLITIAHNVCRQRFRSVLAAPARGCLRGGSRRGSADRDRGAHLEDLSRALGHLAFNQRAALVLRELEGRSYAEIAQALEISVSAVETLLFRARRALREQLEGSLTCGEAELAISRQARRSARPERGRRAASPPPRVQGLRLARPQPAGAALRLEGARGDPAPVIARRSPRHRRRCCRRGGRRNRGVRHRGEGRRGPDRRRGRGRRRVRRGEARPLPRDEDAFGARPTPPGRCTDPGRDARDRDAPALPRSRPKPPLRALPGSSGIRRGRARRPA